MTGDQVKRVTVKELRGDVLIGAQEHVYAAEHVEDASEDHQSCVCCCIPCDANLSAFEAAVREDERERVIEAVAQLLPDHASNVARLVRALAGEELGQ